MTKTIQDVAEEALLELGAADADDPAGNPTDIAFAKRRYTALFEALEDKAFWDIDAVPERIFIPLAQHVAWSMRTAFGQPNYAPVNDRGHTPLQQIEALSMIDGTGFATQGQYF